jgi:FAD/FMN-containing dehydrogenase
METLYHPDAVAPFLTDTSGLSHAHCEAVMVPQTVEEIPEALALAGAAGQTITLSGAHTATTGAA